MTHKIKLQSGPITNRFCDQTIPHGNYGGAVPNRIMPTQGLAPESEHFLFISLSIVPPLPQIAVVAVMCKPHRCPHINMTGNICVYCPGGPDSDFEYSTQSYTGYEPTSMRAIRAR